MKQLDMVREFHEKYGVPTVTDFNRVKKDRIFLRIGFIIDEVKELVEADQENDFEHLAKEACDVLYVILGCALEFGYQEYFEDWPLFGTKVENYGRADSLTRLKNGARDFRRNWSSHILVGMLYDLEEYIYFVNLQPEFERCFDEVHRSNMSKGTNGVPVFRPDGKVLKGEDYSPADLSFLTIK